MNILSALPSWLRGLAPALPSHRPPPPPAAGSLDRVSLTCEALPEMRPAAVQHLADLTWTWLEKAFPGSTGSPERTRQALLRLLAELSPETYEHSRRVARLARRLARRSGLSPRQGHLVGRSALWAEVGLVGVELEAMGELAREELARHCRALELDFEAVGWMHDIGKLALPRTILDKPGPLTPRERALVELHPLVGECLLERLPGTSELLPAVRSHHERWDGGGYPDRLAGFHIPLAARILALADSFDAMTSRRAYRRCMSIREAAQEIAAQAGRQFDPRLAGEFLASLPR